MKRVEHIGVHQGRGTIIGAIPL